MEKFCKFELHEYMDIYPETHIRTFVAESLEAIEEEAKKYASYMNTNYSGGTTRFVCVMTQSDAKTWIDEQIAKEKSNWQEDSQEFIDKIINLYKQCYEE